MCALFSEALPCSLKRGRLFNEYVAGWLESQSARTVASTATKGQLGLERHSGAALAAITEHASKSAHAAVFTTEGFHLLHHLLHLGFRIHHLFASAQIA